MQKLGYNAMSGLIFVAIGAFFAIYSLADLEIGTAFRMGPGYFPLILGFGLVAVGAAIALRSDDPEAGEDRPVPWRGFLLILLAPLVFGLTVRGLGLVPAVAAIVLISAFGSRRARPVVTLTLTAIVTLFCVLVFHTGLGLPIQLFGPWLHLR